MTENRIESYVESDKERNEGHVDTRSRNFECENPDEHLGCDMGIDGQDNLSDNMNRETAEPL